MEMARFSPTQSATEDWRLRVSRLQMIQDRQAIVSRLIRAVEIEGRSANPGSERREALDAASDSSCWSRLVSNAGAASVLSWRGFQPCPVSSTEMARPVDAL